MKDLFYSINAISFEKRFTFNDDCYQYLYDIKWSKGYSCTRCGCSKEVKGKTSFHRRCTFRWLSVGGVITANILLDYLFEN